VFSGRLLAAGIWIGLGLYFLLAIMTGWGLDRPLAVAGFGTIAGCFLIGAALLASRRKQGLVVATGVGVLVVVLLILWAVLLSERGIGLGEAIILGAMLLAIGLSGVAARNAPEG
jgi:hypothetical protein